MSSLEQVKADIQNLPEEAQALLIDFVAFLKTRYAKSESVEIAVQRQDNQNDVDQRQFLAATHQPLDLTNSAFVGMWQDRPEMQDSTAWVRQQRQQWRG